MLARPLAPFRFPGLRGGLAFLRLEADPAVVYISRLQREEMDYLTQKAWVSRITRNQMLLS